MARHLALAAGVLARNCGLEAYPQRRQSIQRCTKRRPRLHLRQVVAEAEVAAEAEGEVVVGTAVQVEAVGVRVVGLVAVRGGDDGGDDLALRDGDAGDLGRARRLAKM